MATIATPKKVFDAADELHARGTKPTGDLIIEKIGGGSKSTVGPLLSAWEEARGKRRIEPVPASLEERASALVSVIWSEAIAKADAKVAAAQREFDEQLRARDSALQKMVEQITVAEHAQHEAVAALDAERQVSASLRARIEKLMEANKSIDGLTVRLDQACADSALKEQKIIKLETELSVLREHLPQRRKSGAGQIRQRTNA